MAPIRPLLTLSLLVVSSLPTITASKNVVTLGYQPSTCTDGCRDALRLASFSDHDPTVGFYAGQCTSKLFVTSLAACSNAYCPSKETRAGWETFEQICKDYGKVRLMKYGEALELVSDRVEVVNTLLSTDRKEIWEETILVSSEAFDAGFRTEVSLHVRSGVRRRKYDRLGTDGTVRDCGCTCSVLGSDKILCIMVSLLYSCAFDLSTNSHPFHPSLHSLWVSLRFSSLTFRCFPADQSRPSQFVAGACTSSSPFSSSSASPTVFWLLPSAEPLSTVSVPPSKIPPLLPFTPA
jgi:hypothetical protein